jgi:hypothetical protein
MNGWVKRFLNYPHPIRYYLYKKVKAALKPVPEPSYWERICAGQVERPHYGYCIYEAGRLAKVLGHPRVSVIEFGVAGGNGLINIEAQTEAISRELGVEFEIYGFDLETGLPPSDDYRDLPYCWGEGFYKMDRARLEARLKRARLVIGDVAKTVPVFVEQHSPAPIGAVMVDLDRYTSTRSALLIFDQDPRHYLPRVPCCFDDVHTIEFVGGLEAIRQFNEDHAFKKIGKVFAMGHDWIPGGEKIFEFHDFKHPHYNVPVYGAGAGHMPLRD